MLIIHVVGARPNFMKAGPVIIALSQHKKVHQVLVHTGQHYDHNMSEVFFRQLGLPEPDINLSVGSGSHAQQTAQVMVRFEQVVQQYKPDFVLVYGDVNSTIAAALVCSKLSVPVGHVEAGLRSFDRTMPEEINRILTDQLADWLFTPSSDGDENLRREGITPAKIHLVGNVMIDTLVSLMPQVDTAWLELQGRFDLSSSFGLVTLHRPSNVDDPLALHKIVETLVIIAHDLPLLFPIHPRTRHRLANLGLSVDRLLLTEPLGYLEFLALQNRASFVITDSGGVQEETSFLGTPCLTVRENTERPITIALGTNKLVGHNMPQLRSEVQSILAGKRPSPQPIPLWDGHAAKRIASILL
ncbi:MAG: UDP-N-acetylglucosamine 2-epimerase (non-hydrolyzing) [Anaerolineae bacterium]|nr:UDP-N-acetylglucosamine 2-epimerase (non-hydrolyzing) [Anaerolineae bacterium]